MLFEQGQIRSRYLYIPFLSLPVASHRAEKELIEEIRWAKNALQQSLDNSADHKPVVMILSSGIQYL